MSKTAFFQESGAQPAPQLMTGDVKADAKLIEVTAQSWLFAEGKDVANLFQQELQALTDKGPDYLKKVFDQMSQDKNSNGNSPFSISVYGDHISISFDDPLRPWHKEIDGTISDDKAIVTIASNYPHVATPERR